VAETGSVSSAKLAAYQIMLRGYRDRDDDERVPLLINRTSDGPTSTRPPPVFINSNMINVCSLVSLNG